MARLTITAHKTLFGVCPTIISFGVLLLILYLYGTGRITLSPFVTGVIVIACLTGFLVLVHLAAIGWKVVCPQCGGEARLLIGQRRRYYCSACGYQERTHLPI
jgi:hypothetical protein